MTNSLLSKLSKNLEAVDPNKEGKVPMTELQVSQCKAAIKRDGRGYNVQPNSFDLATPYRVAINYNNDWNNFGNFKSADVAAAVGTIVSSGYFGEKAKAGMFDEKLVTENQEFLDWMADARNLDIITRANGELPPIHGSSVAEDDDRPF